MAGKPPDSNDEFSPGEISAPGPESETPGPEQSAAIDTSTAETLEAPSPAWAANVAADLDTGDADSVIEAFDLATTANWETAGRQGAVVDLPKRGRLVVSGDLHDHPTHLDKIIRLARLDNEDHHVILQEIIHGHAFTDGYDLSIRTLARVAALKVARPNQVHLLLANHELAQTRHEKVTKDGVSVCELFNDGVDHLYGEEADRIRHALVRFVRSLPLAVRCANGLFCSHSLPSVRGARAFDKKVLGRGPDPADLEPGGSAYEMVWGRQVTPAWLKKLGKAWGVKVFVIGHQPAEYGYDVVAERCLVLSSDHDHGVVLLVDLGEPANDVDDLIRKIIPLSLVASASF